MWLHTNTKTSIVTLFPLSPLASLCTPARVSSFGWGTCSAIASLSKVPERYYHYSNVPPQPCFAAGAIAWFLATAILLVVFLVSVVSHTSGATSGPTKRRYRELLRRGPGVLIVDSIILSFTETKARDPTYRTRRSPPARPPTYISMYYIVF